VPETYIIILNYNRAKDTIECVTSILESSYTDFQILVVDNGSSPEDFNELFRSLKGKDKIDLHRNSVNLGYAGGNNIGIKIALKKGAKYIWILNNDTVVDKNALMALVNTMKSDAKIGIASSTLVYYERPSEIWIAGGTKTISGLDLILTRFGYSQHRDYVPNTKDCNPKPLVNAAGTSLLIRREVFDDIGLFDEDYFLYREETDFCIRAIRKGWKIVYVPCSIVLHKYKYGRMPPWVTYYFSRNSLLLLKKNFGRKVAFSGLFLIPLGLFVLAVTNSCEKENLIKHIKAILLGVLDFLLGNKGRLPRII